MKKLLALLFCGMFLNLSLGLPVLAIEDVAANVEHVKLPKKLAKKTPTNIVMTSDTYNSIVEFNTLQLTFAQDFAGKTAMVGDLVPFLLKDGLKTVEGTVILPESTKVVAQVAKIEKPKSFNRSGKIYLEFKYVETPDGVQTPIEAKVFNKKEFLSRGKLNALGKGFGSTFAGMAVGTAAGCGIGIAASAVIVGGFAIGLPIGLAIGIIPGLLTPGLNYKAKAGDTINIQLLSNLTLNK